MSSNLVVSSREALAQWVIERVHVVAVKLTELEEDIRALWVEFESLPKGETIAGCATKKEFCERKLHRTARAVRYLLAGGNPNNPTRGEIISPPTAVAILPAAEQADIESREVSQTLPPYDLLEHLAETESFLDTPLLPSAELKALTKLIKGWWFHTTREEHKAFLGCVTAWADLVRGSIHNEELVEKDRQKAEQERQKAERRKQRELRKEQREAAAQGNLAIVNNSRSECNYGN